MTRFFRTALAAGLSGAVVLAAGAASALSLVRDAEIERTLRQMSAPIYQAAGLAPTSVEMYMVNDRSLNAFVVGGRRIFLHTGLLRELETPEELLGVIAHETGHIAGGHEARRSINLRNAQGPALLGVLAGIAAGVAAGSPEVGVAAVSGSQGAVVRSILRNSRAEEASADQAAINYLTRAGVNPLGLQRVIERFRGQEVLSIGNLDPYVLTHPLGTERMSLMARSVAQAQNREWTMPPEIIYWHGRMRAKLRGFLVDPTRVLDRLEGEPDTEFNLYQKAVALHRLPDPVAARRTVDALIAKRQKDPFYLELKGQILHESGQAAEAVPYYRKASQIAPNEPLLKAALGRALLQLNEPRANAEALVILKEARSKDLADVAALRDLATAYERAGDVGMATLATAERYALVNNRKPAIQLARRAAKLLPQGSPGWLRAQDILKLDVEN
ncbi:MAG: M48 family metalloprotease [Pseudomonadota bacterium]